MNNPQRPSAPSDDAGRTSLFNLQLPNGIATWALVGIIGVLALLLFSDGCESKEVTKTTYEIKRDTLILTIYDTIRVIAEPTGNKGSVIRSIDVDTVFIDRYMAEPLIVDRVIRDTIMVEVLINNYSDTIRHDGATLAYEHTVAGSLMSSYYDIQVDRVDTTKTVTINRTKEPFVSLWLGGGTVLESQPTFNATADLTFRKFELGVGYNLNERVYSVSYRRKVFSR